MAFQQQPALSRRARRVEAGDQPTFGADDFQPLGDWHAAFGEDHIAADWAEGDVRAAGG